VNVLIREALAFFKKKRFYRPAWTRWGAAKWAEQEVRA